MAALGILFKLRSLENPSQAPWFIAQTKLGWREQYPRDPTLPEQLGTEELPALSLANIRKLLRAVMPWPQLTPGVCNRSSKTGTSLSWLLLTEYPPPLYTLGTGPVL
jgi:hypothetical protein